MIMSTVALAHAFVRPLIRAQCAEVREGARRVIASAAHGAMDEEAVHDYRVALRKLRTLLKAAAPLFKRRAVDRLADGLRRFARAAGAVRDEEVLAETLRGLTLPAATRGRVDAWLTSRADRERALRRQVIAQLAPAGDALHQPPSEAEGAAEESEGSPPEPSLSLRGRRGVPMSLSHALTLAQELPLRAKAGHVATRTLAVDALERAAQKTREEAALPELGTPDTFHELRIRWKGVRYSGELLSKAVARSGPHAQALQSRVKIATKMQKRLGDLHDLDEAIAAISRARALAPGDRMVVHHRLRTARQALAARLEKELPAALALLGDDGGGSVE